MDALDSVRMQWYGLTDVEQQSMDNINKLVDAAEALLQDERSVWMSTARAAELFHKIGAEAKGKEVQEADAPG